MVWRSRVAGAMLLVFLLSAGACRWLDSERPAEPLPTARIPEFTLRDISGREVSSASFRGKVLLLDYWATWCKPCEKEMPEFQKLQDRYQDRGLVVVGIAMDTDPVDVGRFAKRLGIRYTLLMGTPEVQEKLGLQGLPTTFIVDREGRIRQKVIGFEYPEEFQKAVEELL